MANDKLLSDEELKVVLATLRTTEATMQKFTGELIRIPVAAIAADCIEAQAAEIERIKRERDLYLAVPWGKQVIAVVGGNEYRGRFYRTEDGPEFHCSISETLGFSCHASDVSEFSSDPEAT